MNKSTAVFLINDRVRMIRASYEADTATQKASTEFFKTFDHTIKVGDLINVVSNTRKRADGLRVCRRCGAQPNQPQLDRSGNQPKEIEDGRPRPAAH